MVFSQTNQKKKTMTTLDTQHLKMGVEEEVLEVLVALVALISQIYLKIFLVILAEVVKVQERNLIIEVQI